MTQIYISPQNASFQVQKNMLNIPFQSAEQYLQFLRPDYFQYITIHLPNQVNEKQFKFMMHLTRLIKQKALIHLQNKEDSEEAKKFFNIATKIGLYKVNSTQFQTENQLNFSKIKPQIQQNSTQKNNKLAIGFQSQKQEQIDEEQLMKNQSINIQKKTNQSCAQKPRACANCNCGRKDNQQPVISKQKLVESVNQGKPVSGCGKCYLGDSFRCGSCPYKGLPAFKPGDKLKLMDEGQVIVETGEIKVQSGKVKIQL